MKANELMIGDWVNVTCEENCPPSEILKLLPKIGRVVGLDGDTIYVDFVDFGFMLGDIEPIPITPDILEANGFGYTEGDEELTHFYLGEPHFCKDMDLHIGTNNRGDFWLNTYNNEIHGLRYVHELQHALRICGKNDITL